MWANQMICPFNRWWHSFTMAVNRTIHRPEVEFFRILDVYVAHLLLHSCSVNCTISSFLRTLVRQPAAVSCAAWPTTCFFSLGPSLLDRPLRRRSRHLSLSLSDRLTLSNLSNFSFFSLLVVCSLTICHRNRPRCSRLLTSAVATYILILIRLSSNFLLFPILSLHFLNFHLLHICPIAFTNDSLFSDSTILHQWPSFCLSHSTHNLNEILFVSQFQFHLGSSMLFHQRVN